jgi:hypothetical protein
MTDAENLKEATKWTTITAISIAVVLLGILAYSLYKKK